MTDLERIFRLEQEVAALKQRTGAGGLTVGAGLKLTQSGNNARLELAPVAVSPLQVAAIPVSALPALPTRNTYVLVCTNGKLAWMQAQEFACPI